MRFAPNPRSPRGKTIALLLISAGWFVTVLTSFPAMGNFYLWWTYAQYNPSKGVIRKFTDRSVKPYARLYYFVDVDNLSDVRVLPEVTPMKKIGDEITILLKGDGNGFFVSGRNLAAVEFYKDIAMASMRKFGVWFTFLLLPSLAGLFKFQKIRAPKTL